MATMHALLVGIDEYAGPVGRLAGCRNDINAAERVLAARAKAAGAGFSAKVLLNGDATRDAVISAFREHLGAATAGDTALFWFSGHGSQEQAAAEHLPYEPDRLNETLVLADSRTPGGVDLADKELGLLVGEVAAAGAQILVVLDCCHAGSGVRSLDTTTKVRRAPTSFRDRARDSYLDGVVPSADANSRDWSLPAASDYVLLAACRSDQTAKEITVGGERRGALSAALEVALAERDDPSFVDLHRRASAVVDGQIAHQSPVLECRPADRAGTRLLGDGTGAWALPTVRHKAGRWQLSLGELHGIPGSGADPTALAIYDALDEGALDAGPLLRATTVEVSATTSTLALDGPYDTLDRTRVYGAVLEQVPGPCVRVHVALDVPDELRDLVASTAGLTRVASPADAAIVLRRAADGAVHLVRPGERTPALVALPAGERPSADRLAAIGEDLIAIANWAALLARRNPATRLGGALAVDLLDIDGELRAADTDGTTIVTYRDSKGSAVVRVRITNTSDQRLFIGALALSERFGITPLLPGEGEWVGSGEELWAVADDGTRDLHLSVPAGQHAAEDVLVVLAATAPFDTRPLSQGDMAMEPVHRRSVEVALGDTDRALTTAPPARPSVELDWTAIHRRISTVLVGAGTPIGAADVALDGGTLEIVAHPALRATATLASSSTSQRSTAVPLVPPGLLDDPGAVPFSFATTRGRGEDVDVVELTDLVDAASVSRDQPLVLRVSQRLGPDEVVLPVAFDGRDYLPLGVGVDRDGTTVITLTRLPLDIEAASRSLGGSLKILFRKLVARRLGASYDWPHLSLVTRGDDGEHAYEHDPTRVRTAIAGAERVLLLVHGIIGDTRGLADAAFLDDGIGDDFDAVLALDYENLDTPIEQTAADLAQALAEVGIGDDDGPRVTIAAHSMGGLVSRCFIERHGGDAVVDRLVTVGTPHRGSPWPRVQDAATTLLGLGLNGVVTASFGIPGGLAAAAAFLARAAEENDTALDQMKEGSTLLSTLASAPDPGIPYVLVRGVEAFPAGTDAGTVSRIVAKLTGTALDVVFGGEAHDVAVSISSAAGAGATWSQPPQVIDAKCNHMSYFSSDEGRAAVAAALAP